MRAARLSAPQTFEFVEVETPRPKDGEVLVRVERVSVCGSDTHMTYEAQWPEERYPMEVGVPCHEIAGTVVESRAGGVKDGQRVIVLPDFGQGGLVEYIAVPGSMTISLPDTGSLDEWLMCEPAGTVLHATKKWGNLAGRRVGILGQGATGLCFTALAALGGAEQVIAFDRLDYRLGRALEFGATNAINTGRDDAVEALMEATRGHGVDVMVDASGDPAGLNQAVELVNRYGTVLGFSLVGFDSIVPFRHMAWMRKVAGILPCSSRVSPDPTADIRETVALRERGWFDPGRLVTHRRTFSDLPEAYEMYAHHTDGVIKVVVEI